MNSNEIELRTKRLRYDCIDPMVLLGKFKIKKYWQIFKIYMFLL